MVLNLTPTEAVDALICFQIVEEILEVAPNGEGIFEGYVPDRRRVMAIRERLTRQVRDRLRTMEGGE
jgi:hypothetical protein